MSRKTAHDFDQDLLILFDAYVHGAIDRRGFLDKAARFAVGGVTAVMLLDQLSPNFARPRSSSPRMYASRRSISSSTRPRVRQGARLPRAAGQGRREAARHTGDSREPRPEPAYRGHRPPAGPRRLRRLRARRLLPARRLSGDEDKARELFPKLDQAKIARTSWRRRLAQVAARDQRQDRRGRFLLRRRMVNLLATRLPDLAAGVPSTASPTRRRPEDQGALLIQSAEIDERINASWPAFERAQGGRRALRAVPLPGTSTGSTTTPRRATTRRRRSWRGSGRSRSSTRTCGDGKAREQLRTRIPSCVHLCESFRPSRSACVSPSPPTVSLNAVRRRPASRPTRRRALSRPRRRFDHARRRGRAKVQFPFEGPQKTRWSNLPIPMFQREGLWLADLTPAQRAAVNDSAHDGAEPGRLSKSHRDHARRRSPADTEWGRGRGPDAAAAAARGGGGGGASSARTSITSPSLARRR